MTSVELFLHHKFYGKHPYFEFCFKKNRNLLTSSIENLVLMSASSSDDDKLSGVDDVIKNVAIKNVNNKTWSCFLCILALSSVVGHDIISYYPDTGADKYKMLFNGKIQPRLSQHAISTIELNVMFCYDGIKLNNNFFHPNHFVPLIIQKIGKKRHSQGKISESGKSKKTKTIMSFLKPLPPVNNAINSEILIGNPENPSSEHMSIKSNNIFSDNAICSSSVNNDIASYRQKVAGSSDRELLNMARDVYKPDKNYLFKKQDGRSFRIEWLNRFPWLCYSPSLNGAFCLSCVLFGDRFHSKNLKIKKLYTEPFVQWADANRSFKKHESGGQSSLHAFTYPLLVSLLGGNLKPINEVINEAFSKTKEINRKKLTSIVDTIKLCGRLNLPLRGHRDDSKFHSEIGDYSENQVGNFIELLNFRVRAGDKILEDHLKNCKANATYISKTSQNQLIEVCGSVIKEKILKDVKKAKFYSIIADEAADSAINEQMSLVLRYVNDQNDIKEDFIGFIHCKDGLSGSDLAGSLLERLKKLGLDVQDCRGQGYDGAGAVAGHINGLAARIKNINDKALYTHCHSHRLNLVICKSCQVQLVRNLIDQVGELTYFFGFSQSRKQILEKEIEHRCPEVNRKKLKDPGRTRWIERIIGLDTFQETYVAVFHALDKMSVNHEKIVNRETSAKATSFLKLISSFSFIVTLVITREIFDLTIDVTTNLQKRDLDVMGCKTLIDNLINSCANVRNKVEEYHSSWYQQAISLAEKVGVNAELPRRTGKQLYRDNQDCNSPDQYYKCVVTIPLLDHINTELKNRFGQGQKNIIEGLVIIPTELQKIKKDNILDWKEYFMNFCKFYESDFPNFIALPSELTLWENLWLHTSQDIVPDTVATTLKLLNFDGFSNIKVALRLLATFPVTSCECERSFSALRRLKNYTRSTMVENRLNGLAMMHVHKSLEPDTDDVINRYAESNRRLDFV